MYREQQTSDRGGVLQPPPLGSARTRRPGLKHRATCFSVFPLFRILHSAFCLF